MRLIFQFGCEDKIKVNEINGRSLLVKWMVLSLIDRDFGSRIFLGVEYCWFFFMVSGGFIVFVYLFSDLDVIRLRYFKVQWKKRVEMIDGFLILCF